VDEPADARACDSSQAIPLQRVAAAVLLSRHRLIVGVTLEYKDNLTPSRRSIRVRRPPAFLRLGGNIGVRQREPRLSV